MKATRPGWKRTHNLAIERGLRFLLDQRSLKGWWRDFETLAGESDEWVTAYAACCIVRIPGGRRLAQQALRLLLSRSRSHGWGYNQNVPPDCDSTAWVCRLIELLGRTNLVAYSTAIAWLRASTTASGLPTYPAEEPIRAFTRLPQHYSFAGWTSPHTCVTAGAAALDPIRSLRLVLRRLRHADGGWSGYWWVDRAFPTMLAADALGGDRRLGEWAKTCDEDSPFATACRVRCGAKLAQRLIAMQQPDGGWPASARLRVPPPDARNPVGRGRVTRDQNRIFTTATALWALHDCPVA